MPVPVTPSKPCHEGYRLRLKLITAISLALACPPWAQAEAQAKAQAAEIQIKAAFLYKFGSYVEWPSHAFERADSPFVIGVIASDRFVKVLEQTVSERGMNGHRIVVRRMQRGEAPQGVHIMFVAGTDAATLDESIAAAKGLSTLIVTDAERGLSAGSMISFVIEDNKVRFDIAPEAAEQSHLKISARLMSVARKVLIRTVES